MQLEEAAGEGVVGAYEVAVLRADDHARSCAQRKRIERHAEQHVRVEQRDELLRWLNLGEPEHDGRRLVVRRVADLVDERRVAHTHVVVHERRAHIQPAVRFKLLLTAGEEPRDRTWLARGSMRVEERDGLPRERVVALGAEHRVHAHPAGRCPRRPSRAPRRTS